jgi:hypothetical protein
MVRESELEVWSRIKSTMVGVSHGMMVEGPLMSRILVKVYLSEVEGEGETYILHSIH